MTGKAIWADSMHEVPSDMDEILEITVSRRTQLVAGVVLDTESFVAPVRRKSAFWRLAKTTNEIIRVEVDPEARVYNDERREIESGQVDRMTLAQQQAKLLAGNRQS